MQKDLIIALDFPTWTSCQSFLEQLEGEQLFVKVGMELYLQNGPQIIEKIKKAGHKVFLDLKLHDIPNTVYAATKGLMQFGVDLLTVHAAGGSEMLRAACRAVDETAAKTKLLAITQLTSTSETMMHEEQGIQGSVLESVLRYAKVAQEAGIHGVVSSVHETAKIREQSGADFLIVNPGIRLAEDDVADQKRVASPEFARQEGATYIVVGRSITKADQPVERYHHIKTLFVNGK